MKKDSLLLLVEVIFEIKINTEKYNTKMRVINNFRYSRYLNTSDLDWHNSLNNKAASNQRSFNF